MKGAREEQQAWNGTELHQASIERIEEMRAQVADLAHNPLDAALNAASRAAGVDADRKNLSMDSPVRHQMVKDATAEAQAQYEKDRATYVHNTIADQQDSLALTTRELELVGANDNYRQAELDKLKLSLSIRRQFPDMAQEDVDALMAGVEAQDAMNARLKIAAANMDELRGFGSQLVDDVLSPDAWTSWGDLGKAVLKDIENEFIKLALLNPIKNLMNGDSALPTLGGVLGKLGSVFGNSTGGILNSADTATFAGQIQATLPHNASGTENWSGGMTWVNENGPEIADLPNGTRIYPAATTRQMMAGNDNGGGGASFHFDLRGAVVTQDLLEQMNAIGAGAAARGAAGGAQLSASDAARSQRRSLAGR